jgi:hypothetical protein
VIAPDNEVYKLTDQFARSFSGSGGSEAGQELAVVDKLVLRLSWRGKAKQVNNVECAYENVSSSSLDSVETLKVPGGWAVRNSVEPMLESVCQNSRNCG